MVVVDEVGRHTEYMALLPMACAKADFVLFMGDDRSAWTYRSCDGRQRLACSLRNSTRDDDSLSCAAATHDVDITLVDNNRVHGNSHEFVRVDFYLEMDAKNFNRPH